MSEKRPIGVTLTGPHAGEPVFLETGPRLKTAPKRGTCSFCGHDEGDLDRIGSTRVYLCNDQECQRQFDRDSRDADEEMRQQAHEDVDRSFGL